MGREVGGSASYRCVASGAEEGEGIRRSGETPVTLLPHRVDSGQSFSGRKGSSQGMMGMDCRPASGACRDRLLLTALSSLIHLILV